MTSTLERFLLHIADTNLVAAQRLGEVTGHAPELEQDISLTNIALDHLERARAIYSRLAESRADGSTEDTFAFTRGAEDFFNLCLAELPNRDYGHLILRQFLLDAWHLVLLPRLSDSTNALLRESWKQWLDQTRYAHRYTSGWVIRLGDGTNESHARMRTALAAHWPFCREVRELDADDRLAQQDGFAQLDGLGDKWLEQVNQVLDTATLKPPRHDEDSQVPCGKQGQHTPFLAELLDELPYMHRRCPNLNW